MIANASKPVLRAFIVFSIVVCVCQPLVDIAASAPRAAKPIAANKTTAETLSKQQRQQPLANLDKVIKQASEVKMDAITDPKLTSNLTSVFNEMANNMRKMFMENKRLQMQVQETLVKVQNATGINATTIQSQMTNQTDARVRFNNLLNSVDPSVITRFNVTG